DVTLIGSHVLPISSARNEDTVDQIKLQGNWSNGDLTLRFGAQYVDDQKQFRSFDSFANNDWQAYSGYGPVSNNPRGVDLPDTLFHPFGIGGGFISGWGNNGRLVPSLLAYDPFAVKAYLESLGNPQTKVIPGQNTGCCNPAFDGVYRIIEN